MCGIFFYFGYTIKLTNEELIKAFELIKYRGPDETYNLTRIYPKINFGFHRLSINGLDKLSGQPFFIDNVVLMCNGEIYNYKELGAKYELNFKTKSDCEVIIHLYKKLGFEKMLNELEGVFSIVLFDNQSKMIHIARDPIGIRPLFYAKLLDENEWIFASEAKCLYTSFVDLETINQFKPGSYLSFHIFEEFYSINEKKYINLFNDKIDLNYNNTIIELKRRIEHAVEIRCNITDRPVGALLSGGIDSSIVAMIAKNKLGCLRTFSIGLEGGSDLVPAKKAAEAIGSIHTEVIFKIEEGLGVIKEIIRILETPDITTIRASLPMYLLAKYIKEHTDIVVVLSGEGPDEVLAGYLYNHKAPDSKLLQLDAQMRIKQLPYYDVLRADRATASNSLEVRVPFLCKNIVRLAMGTNPDYRNPNSVYNEGIEKKMMRRGFSNLIEYNPSATDEQCEKWNYIIGRPKEAFSDGVGYEWKQALKNLAEKEVSDIDFYNREEIYPIMTPENKEAFLYRRIYESIYGRSGAPLVNKFWLPTWGEHGGDPSATVLDIHRSKHTF